MVANVPSELDSGVAVAAPKKHMCEYLLVTEAGLNRTNYLLATTLEYGLSDNKPLKIQCRLTLRPFSPAVTIS